MIGQTLGHYRILEKIGQGGMGVVYKSLDTLLDRYVAIKILPPERTADPERQARFMKEARTASALNHPNIVTMHDLSSDSGHDFIVMEYIAGKSLDHLIPVRGMPLNEALKIAVQTADALARAHSAGILHRDLKPANIMVEENSRVKVVDFGLAKLMEPADPEDQPTLGGTAGTAEGAVVGTAAYMSPEQAEGKKLDARSDIFSFGSVLYEMVCGQKAFPGSSAISTLSSVVGKEPDPLPGHIPPEVSKAILRCLRKDPERRWQSMSDLRVTLLELIEESESHPSMTVSRPRRSRIGFLWIALPALLLALVGLLFWWSRPGASPPPALFPLSSEDGSERYPSFSPDGRQVAFTWSGEKKDNLDIYIKMVGETHALRLTSDPASDIMPAWSPNGRRIAFQRLGSNDRTGIWTVSPLGGEERKVADISVSHQMSWSPDGRWLAVGQKLFPNGMTIEHGILLVPSDGGEPRVITNPRAPESHSNPAFSPDGRLLAYARCATFFSCELFIQPLNADYLPQGTPRQVTRQGSSVYGLAWSRDGRSLIYGASPSWGVVPCLWRTGADGRNPPERLAMAGFESLFPSVAPQMDRLVFSRDNSQMDIWKFTPGNAPEPFLATTVHDFEPKFSPDGSRIAYTSSRFGDVTDIWVSRADGSHPFQLTRDLGNGQGQPIWSPDGKTILFESQGKDGMSHVFTIHADGGKPRQITSGKSGEGWPQWSRDGQWIYYTSEHSGRMEIYRIPYGPGAVQRLTDNMGNVAVESTDGKTLFYTKFDRALYSRPLAGGPEQKVLDFVARNNFEVMEDGIYYIGSYDREGKAPLLFYDFSSRTSRPLVRLEGTIGRGFTVSPDRRLFLYALDINQGSDLVMIENFR